jgi:hypothetical protein
VHQPIAAPTGAAGRPAIIRSGASRIRR